MNFTEQDVITSAGVRLEISDETFGELRESAYLLGDGESLRERMQEDGYLYLRGFFQRDDVMAARAHIMGKLMAEGFLEPGPDLINALVKPGGGSQFRPDLTRENPPLHRLLYDGVLMDFYREFFGEAVRHYDFTWLRVMGPAGGTQPHCDVVYMGRGTREKLLTAWVPLGDAPVELGGLTILEGSHHKHTLLRKYLSRDVDTYCSNGQDANEIEEGKKQWTWNGVLAKDPASLRRKLGGRWLTTDYEAGDLLTFGMHTVHGSTDNKTNRVRLSSDSRYQPASLPADERWIGAEPMAHGPLGKRGRIC